VYGAIDSELDRLAPEGADLNQKNLQANLRSQYTLALDDLPQLLRSVNHLFYQNTAENSYATLFFADYDDVTRRLRYANCGHLPPLLLRAGKASSDGYGGARTVNRLAPTCTVLGLFDSWEPYVEEVALYPGDLLVMYTDGVTEAENASGEDFGECRLIETLKSCAQFPVDVLLHEVVGAVQSFSPREQQDDITLVIARGLSQPAGVTFEVDGIYPFWLSR
jgi:serine phosphatase RsbU (regulator of sigma subunit)